MNKKAVIVGLLLLCAAGLAVAASRRQAGAVDAPAGEGDNFDPAPLDYNFSAGADGFIGSIEDWTRATFDEIESYTVPQQNPYLPSLQTQIAAVLAMLKWSEGTANAADSYRVCYAYKHTIASFADHPAITKEWGGEPLSDKMCAGAGLGPGCVSTAAGAYQIIKPTWVKLKAQLNLPDFSPASQDAAAVELLRQRGALAYLERGDLAGAVNAARKEWASLTGAGYGQGERSIAWLTAKFTDAGGVLA
jgi:muramidase (phage lysozyme)